MSARARWAAILGAALAVVLLVVGLRALGVGRHRPPVVLIGDSITANLERVARDELSDDWALTVDGEPGFLAGQQVTTAENASRFPFRQAVVNLGTNDAMTSDHDLGETIASLERIVVALQDVPCVHLVTVSEAMVNGSDDAGARARTVNDAIRSLAARYANVSVVEWAAIVEREQRARGEPITTDTVHPDEVGNELLARAYGDALAACSA